MRPEFGFQVVSNWPSIGKITMTIKVFWNGFVSPVKFSYWFKSHINIITGSEVMTIFFYKGLSRHPENGNISVWVPPNNWRLEWFRDTKFGRNVSNKMLLKAAKSKVAAFTVSELLSQIKHRGRGLANYPLSPRLKLRENQQRRKGGKLPRPPLTQVRVKLCF